MGRSIWKENQLSEMRNYRKFTARQKVEIVLAGLRGDRSVRDVCREHGIAETLYYSWRDKIVEAGRRSLPLSYLERLRWDGHFTCRFCAAVDGGWWQMADGLRRCAACRSETSVTAGGIFAGTRTPLVSWFAAVWYVVNQKQGVSALGLQRVLGLGSYQTAWAWLHKLRRAMVLPGRELLTDAVEIDASYFGARRVGCANSVGPRNRVICSAIEFTHPTRASARRGSRPAIARASRTAGMKPRLPSQRASALGICWAAQS